MSGDPSGPNPAAFAKLRVEEREHLVGRLPALRAPRIRRSNLSMDKADAKGIRIGQLRTLRLPPELAAALVFCHGDAEFDVAGLGPQGDAGQDSGDPEHPAQGTVHDCRAFPSVWHAASAAPDRRF